MCESGSCIGQTDNTLQVTLSSALVGFRNILALASLLQLAPLALLPLLLEAAFPLLLLETPSSRSSCYKKSLEQVHLIGRELWSASRAERTSSALATQLGSFGFSTDKRVSTICFSAGLRQSLEATLVKRHVANSEASRRIWALNGPLKAKPNSCRKIVSRAGIKQTVTRRSSDAFFAHASALQWSGATSRSTSHREPDETVVYWCHVTQKSHTLYPSLISASYHQKVRTIRKQNISDPIFAMKEFVYPKQLRLVCSFISSLEQHHTVHSVLASDSSHSFDI